MLFLNKCIFIIKLIFKAKLILFGLEVEFVRKKYLKSPQWLRNLKFKKRPFWRLDKFRLNNIIDDGGWHFCNLKKS